MVSAATRKRRTASYIGAGILPGQGGGGGATVYRAIFAWHQSNMAGAQTAAKGGSLLSPADDAVDQILQYSPNGGTGAGDPSKARILLPAADPLLFPNGASVDVAIGPALSYAKACLGDLGPNEKFVIFPFGKGGTSMLEYMDYRLVGGSSQPLFESAKVAWEQFLTENPTATIHSMITSPSENEMLEGTTTPSQVATRIDNLFTSWRGMQKASPSTPIYMCSPTPEFVTSDAYRAILLEVQKACYRHPNVGVAGGLPGFAIGGDQVHYTNVGQRLRGPKLAAIRAITTLLQTQAPSQVTVHSLNSQQLTFTSVGAPCYDIQTSPPGANTWTSNLWGPNQENTAGQSFTMTLPGSGSRDYRIIAKGRFSDSVPSSTGNYTVPSATVPARVVELDFHNAPVDGSGNITSVASIGSDTSSWTPVATAGTGALAAMQKVAQSSKNILQISSANKRLRKTGLLVPAGDYSIAVPFFYASVASNGQLVGFGGGTTLGDISFSLANSGVNIKLQHVNTSVAQLITTGNPLSGQTNKWHLAVATYDRAGNLGKLYLNGALLAASGTLTQRAASPSNPNSVDLFGANVDTASNGLPNAKIPTVMAWNQVLTSDEIGALQAMLQTDYSLTFG